MSPVVLQFNSLNDIKVHPRNTDIYFTDTTYGYLQDFKPLPGLPEHIYRFNVSPYRSETPSGCRPDRSPSIRSLVPEP
jgi:sugar lactone lactonase YvrE